MMRSPIRRRLADSALCSRGHRAFSLVELLVVIAVIALLLALVVPSLQGPTTGISLQGATDAAAEMVDMASRTAQSRQTPARLVINIDPLTPGYLRQLAVLRRNPANTNQWSLTGRPQQLPEEGFFDIERSAGSSSMRIDFRSTDPQGGTSGTEVAAYEFDHNGHFQPVGAEPDPRIVFVAGILEESPTRRLVIPESRELSRSGFLLRRYGNVTRFTSPEEIP